MLINLKHKDLKFFSKQIPVSTLCEEMIKNNDNYKFDRFCYIIEKYSTKYNDQFSFYMGNNAKEKYAGSVFEIFVEYLLRVNEGNRFFGIVNYEPIVGEDDYGVDGVGTSLVNMLPATVQVKYRSNPDYFLNANNDKISNFYAHSLAKYLRNHNLENLKNNVLLITSCSGLNYKIKEKMYCDDIRVVERKDIKEFVDHVKGFWYYFYESVKLSENTSKDEN